MWVATFSVTATGVGLTKVRSTPEITPCVHPDGGGGGLPPLLLRAAPSPGRLSGDALTCENDHVSVRRRTAPTKGGTGTYPFAHPGNHVSIFTCMDE